MGPREGWLEKGLAQILSEIIQALSAASWTASSASSRLRSMPKASRYAGSRSGVTGESNTASAVGSAGPAVVLDIDGGTTTASIRCQQGFHGKQLPNELEVPA